uniref:PPIase cyclophilin-type domain-containing protein n=1 Tax=Alexandrium monilatum TaxID=311494 RepID=A0A7S4RIU1_9DINO
MASPTTSRRASGRRCGAVLRAAACCAAFAFSLHEVGFSLPLAGRRSLLGAGLLAGGVLPAHAAEDRYVTLNIDVQDGDGPSTEKVTIRLRPDWAPRGVRRFMKMISLGDLEDAAFYHVDKGAAHFGLPAEPTLPMVPIKDDLVQTSNRRGTVSFKPSSYSGRVNELFINSADNKRLDRAGVAPIGEVVGDGMEVIDRLYSGYGTRPNKFDVKREGNKYLDREFPKLAKIRSVDVDA